MQPALPDEPHRQWQSADDIGTFQQGSKLSQWALARYLVGRALAESVGRTLLVVALVLLGLAAAAQWGLDSLFLAIVFCVLAVMVLLVRAVLRFVLRRLTAAEHYGPIEDRLRELVSETRSDVRKELRRVGLPSRTITLPFLASRLIGRRRQATLDRLRNFEISNAVPKARLDEMHMLLRSGLGGR